jgi:hypothetical protein
MTRIIFTVILITVLGLAGAFPERVYFPVAANSLHSLSYVESSIGLIPPTMEGGHTEVEMGDVNGDGNPDLVSIGDHGSPYVNTDEHGVMVWFGDGTGNWAVYQNGEFGYGGIALGDINNDGLMDIGYGMHHDYSGVDFGDQLIEVALGDGTGKNWTPYDDGLATNGEDWGMFGTDFADVNHDGLLDLGSMSFGCCNGAHVYLNQGDGTWLQSWWSDPGGNGDDQITFGDVNGDGNPDLAVNFEHGSVYLGDESGLFTNGSGNLPVYPASVALGDVNLDGLDELAITLQNGGVQVWQWLSAGTWQNISGSLPSSGLYEAVQLFDMDMDGNGDVIAFGNGQVTVWGGDGAGTWTQIASFSTPAPGYESAFRVGGDVDHNGYPDIVLVSDEGNDYTSANHIHVYKEASVPTTLEIKPVAPSGKKSYQAGAVVFVDWISAVPGSELGTVNLEFSIHGSDGPWQPIASSLSNNGRYQWSIPSETPSTTEAFIRYTLTRSDGSALAVTPAAFNILGTTQEPISGLSADNDSPTILGETTILSATVVSGTNVSYAWDLGDGITATGSIVEHIYPAIGDYTATVTATNAVSQAQATTMVEVYEEPISGLSAVSNGPTILGQTTILTATVVSGTNVAFMWDLGDGITATGSIVEHIYPAIGVYTATVTATNSVSIAQAITQFAVYEEPITGLSAANNSPTFLGEPTILSASVISGTNVIFEWDLGDGITATGAVVSHIYPAVEDFTATVTARNSAGFVVAVTDVHILPITFNSQVWLPLMWRSGN